MEPHKRPPGPLDFMERPIHVGDVIVYATRAAGPTLHLEKGLVEQIDEHSEYVRLHVRRLTGPFASEVMDRMTTTLLNTDNIVLGRCWHRVPPDWVEGKDYVWPKGHEPLLRTPASAGATIQDDTRPGVRAHGNGRSAAAAAAGPATADLATAGSAGDRPGHRSAVGRSRR